MNINFREASTKRAIIWVIGGVVVLVRIALGHNIDADAILDKTEFWIGIAMTIAGAFGFLPDAPVEKKHDLPPIELQSRPATAPELRHDALPPVRQTATRSFSNPADSASTGSTEHSGWNG